MSDRATEFDRMMNPWAYDANGQLTAAARRQEVARTQINSAGSPGGASGGKLEAEVGALDGAATNAEQINGRLGGECKGADDKMGAVAGGLPGFGGGAACKDASGTWDKQVEALSKVIGGLAQKLRTTAKGYRDAEAEAVRSFEQNGG
ncbi:hypothetical protein [Kitasatospora sp. NPDC056531]|uniref:hypothetical protein n=1 Tax=Kitasatospora sp. NPDC056531 TaxID=3345856 RepID=UPI0036ADA497